MKAKAFSPCHITGFFQPSISENPIFSGSTGAGIVLSSGVVTEVEIRESDKPEVEIFANSEPCRCEVTESVIKHLLGSHTYHITVRHELEMPMMQGFGVSGAGALSTALAVDRALNLGLEREELGRIAHIAEVENLTGLGDVIAEYWGGFIIRQKPGAPGVGEVVRIEEEAEVYCFVVDSQVKTKDVLEGKKINGEPFLRRLLKKPDLDNFMKLSAEFARASGLITPGVERALKLLEDAGIGASMCMLGGSIFSFSEDAKDLITSECIETKIEPEGARTL